MLKNFRKMTILSFIFSLLFFSLWLGQSGSIAGDYPTRPISLIIPMSAGGITDIISRRLADLVSKDLDQPIVPINKPGGGGTVGVAELIRSKPDGYTMGSITLSALAIIPHLQSLPYDPLKDISHICAVFPYELGLYVKGDAPWKSFEDLIGYSKKNPGKVSYGSSGPGTVNELCTKLIAEHYNLDWKSVPYKGDAPQIADVLGGHITAGVSGLVPIMPHIKAGRLKLLVITTGDRWPQLPEVPTLLDKGLKWVPTTYLSIGVPAGTSELIRQRLEEAFKKVIQDPNLKKEFEEKFYTRLAYSSGAEYTKLVNNQFYFYKKFLKSTGMTK